MTIDRDVDKWIGQCIKRARKQSGLPQRDVAAAVGISKNHLSVIERGLSSPTIRFLIRFCNALHTTPDVVFGCDTVTSIDPALIAVLADMDSSGQRRVLEMIRLMR